MSPLKTKHVARLAKAKNYILITDKAAVINIRDTNPNKIGSQVKIAAQLAFLYKYREKLDSIISVFEKAVSKKVKKAGK